MSIPDGTVWTGRYPVAPGTPPRDVVVRVRNQGWTSDRVRHRALLRRTGRRGARIAARRALRAPLRSHLLDASEMMSVAMPTDITVVMRDQPGEIARLGELIGADGVHVRGLAAFTGDGHGFVHLLLDDARRREGQGGAGARRRSASPTRARCSWSTSARRGLVDVMLALAEANVNVDLAYTALGGEQARDRHRRRLQRARRAQLAAVRPRVRRPHSPGGAGALRRGVVARAGASCGWSGSSASTAS